MRRVILLQTARMGDLAQTLPLLDRFRREQPQTRLTLLARDPFAQLLLQRGFCHELCLVPNELWQLLSDSSTPTQPVTDLLPAGSFDLLVNLSTGLPASRLAEQIPAKHKLGRIHTETGELRFLGPWAKYLFSVVTDRWSNLLNLVDLHLGIAGLPPKPHPPTLIPSSEESTQAQALLGSFGRRPNRKLIALQTGASDLSRAWSLEHFATLANALQRECDADLVLLGSSDERPRSETLAHALARLPLNLVGHTDVSGLLAVLAQCDLLISNDTGTIHLAAACGTPTLGLFFSTAYYAETAPYGENHTVLQVEIPCAPCDVIRPCAEQICRQHLPPEPAAATALWILRGANASETPIPQQGLSIYRSQFASDGSLAYLPTHPKQASTQFLTGLLRRLLWASALQLPQNQQLHELFSKHSSSPILQHLMAQDAAVFQTLQSLLERGTRASEKLRAQFFTSRRSLEKIQTLHGELTSIETELLQFTETAGAYGSFIRYEFMDMPFQPFPQLAETLHLKYQSLRHQNASFLSTLHALQKHSALQTVRP